MCSSWILPRYSNWSIWTCCDRCPPNLAMFSPDPCSRFRANYLGHRTSLSCHNACPMSGGHHSGQPSYLDSWPGLSGTLARRHMAANAGVSTWAAENGYVPLPQAVSYSIFGLFILEDWQIDLHPKTASCPHWLATFSGHPHHGWLLGTLIACLIGTPIPQRGWITRCVSRKPWSFLSSAPPTTSTSMLRMSISLLRSAINHATISHLHFRSIFFYPPHHWNVIIWCLTSSHDGPMTSCSFWQECLCMVHWADILTQRGDAKADTPKQILSSSLCRVGKCGPQVHTLTLVHVSYFSHISYTF